MKLKHYLLNMRAMQHVLITSMTVIGSLFTGQLRAIDPWAYFSEVRDEFSSES